MTPKMPPSAADLIALLRQHADLLSKWNKKFLGDMELRLRQDRPITPKMMDALTTAFMTVQGVTDLPAPDDLGSL